jgi:hypothetical protein
MRGRRGQANSLTGWGFMPTRKVGLSSSSFLRFHSPTHSSCCSQKEENFIGRKKEGRRKEGGREGGRVYKS